MIGKRFDGIQKCSNIQDSVREIHDSLSGGHYGWIRILTQT